MWLLIAPVVFFCTTLAHEAIWVPWRVKRAERRIAAGRFCRVPILVEHRGQLRKGRGALLGDELVIRGTGAKISAAPQILTATGRGRFRWLPDEMTGTELGAGIDQNGDLRSIGVAMEWESAAQAIRTVGQGPPETPLRARLLTVPLLIIPVLIAMLLLSGVALFFSFWGNDVRATVTDVTADPDYATCSIRWDDGHQHTDSIDCYEGEAVGDVITVRALRAPFHGDAWDSYTIAAAQALPALVTVGTAAVFLMVGWFTSRGPSLTLAPLPASPAVIDRSDGPIPIPTEVSDGSTHLAAWSRMAEFEGWENEPGQAWERPSRMSALNSSMPTWTWMLFFPVGIVAYLSPPSNAVQAMGVAAAAFTGVAMVVVLLSRAWRGVRRLREEGQARDFHAAEYLCFPEMDGGSWWVVLLEGTVPAWMVCLPDRGHPALRGRVLVRGELADGAHVRLDFSDSVWPTVSPLLRLNDDDVADLLHEWSGRAEEEAF